MPNWKNISIITWFHTSASYTFARFPAEVELEGAHSYLANIPLSDYGPSVTLPDNDLRALQVATDDFCLSALKVGFNSCVLVFCEFLAVLDVTYLLHVLFRSNLLHFRSGSLLCRYFWWCNKTRWLKTIIITWKYDPPCPKWQVWNVIKHQCFVIRTMFY